MKWFSNTFLSCLLSLFICTPQWVMAADEEIDFSNEEIAEDSNTDFDEEADFDDEVPADEEVAKEEVAKEPVQAAEKPAEQQIEEPVEKPAEVQAEEPVVEESVEPLEVVEPEAPPAPEPLAPEPTEELSTQVPAIPASDDPDLNYEAQLHDIYVKFHNDKTSDERWSSLLTDKTSERYQIRSGDNLWSISKTIFGDGNYWPKVWSLNSDIKNPHLISPQNSIQFILGDEAGPPAFTVTENATATPPKDKAPLTPAELYEKTAIESQSSLNDSGISEDTEPEIPPPLKVSRPVVKKLPPSLPVWQDVASQGNFDKHGIDYAHRKILDVEDTVALTGYVSEVPIKELGRVSEIETGVNLASSYQYVYVAMSKNNVQIGDIFLAVANRGEVDAANDTIKGFLGYSIEVLGEVQIVEKVEKDDDDKHDYYRALVLNIINPVSVGSSLVLGELEKVKITESGPRNNTVAQIIGGAFFNKRQVYGDESIAYINRGANHGLKVGDILPIRANRKVRNENTEIESNVRPVGWLRVVKTTPNLATTIVVKAWSDILTGDYTGAGRINGEAVSQAIAPADESESSEPVKNKSLSDELDSE